MTDGLELRGLRERDIEQTAELLAARGEPADAVDLRLVLDDPDAGPECVAVVVDGDRVVSTATLLDETVRLGGVDIPAGQVELVATDPDYEGRGLVRELMAWAHRRSHERGHLAQVMIGIPYFYRQFGYSYAIPQHRWRALAKPVPRVDGMTVRRATPADIPAMQALQDAAQSSVQGGAGLRMPHSPACWRWLVARDGTHQLVACRGEQIVGTARLVPPDEDTQPDGRAAPDGNARPDDSARPGGDARPDGSAAPDGNARPDGSAAPAGNARPDGSAAPAGDAAALGELAAVDADAAFALLAHAGVDDLPVQERPGTVAGDAVEPLLADASDIDPKHWWYYARIEDFGALLRHLEPLLVSRLPADAKPEDLLISSFRSHVKFTIGPDGITAMHSGGPEQAPGGKGGCGVPPDALPGLVFGPYGALGLERRLPDCYLEGRRDLMAALFPPITADLLTFYLPT